MRVGESIVLAAEPAEIWPLIREPEHMPKLMTAITRWDVDGEIHSGLGARYRMLLRVGSAEIGGLIEVVEEIPERDLAWTSVTGIDQRGRWRLREQGEGTTRVELRLSYGVAGAGLSGWISEHVAARPVRGHIRASLQELKRQVEQPRQPAGTAGPRG